MPKKGRPLSKDHKKKMADGREKAKSKKVFQEKEVITMAGEKPTVIITGKEMNGFDFWPCLRDALRPIHQYRSCRLIEREIADPAVWNNLDLVKSMLSKYVVLQVGPTVKPKKAKKEKEKKPKKPMSDERKAQLVSQMAKARAAKIAKNTI